MSSSSGLPVRLEHKLVERPWGGEIWFTTEPELPLLIKFIYTREALSFQVHPDDAYAAEHHNSRGKTEMWYIVGATAEARIALGFRASITAALLRNAALSGEIQELVNWVSPRPGDAFFTPAGTIHAIGGGIELWEIQENSDITYRLFDYGRGRELHLDHAMNVTNAERSEPGPVTLPFCCHWFCTDEIPFEGSIDYEPDHQRWQLLICVRGEGQIAGQPIRRGEVWMLPAGGDRFQLRSDQPGELLRVWVP